MVHKYLRVYFLEKCTVEQQNKTLLAAFLDPQVFNFLNEADLNKVKHELDILSQFKETEEEVRPAKTIYPLLK